MPAGPLRVRMAEHGFESNDDYEYRVRCLLSYPARGLRTLAVEGDSERRKTAFANALARALDWPHILYHDFTQTDDPPALATVPDRPDEEGPPPRQLTAFDRVVSEACAYSEAERTILILDQLHAADFREHIRLYHFVSSTEWRYPLATLRANPRTFLLMLISEEPIYHSLQKECFRIWTDSESLRLDYRPEELGLGPDAAGFMAALANLFRHLGASPTRSEYQRILDDALHRARTEEHLAQTIFGWIEGLDAEALRTPQVQPLMTAAVDALHHYLGRDEIELGGSG